MTKVKDIAIEDISLYDLVIIEKISNKASGILSSSKLLSLSKILTYYNTHHTFLKIKNCGNITENELVNLCTKYLRNYSLITDDQSLSLNVIIRSLNSNQLETLNHYFKYLLSNLEKHTYQSFVKISPTLDLNEILEAVIFKNHISYKTKGIGVISYKYTVDFKSNITAFINILPTIPDKLLHKEEIKFIIKCNITNIKGYITRSLENYFDINNDKLKLFKFLDIVIIKENLFSPLKYRVFLFYYMNINSNLKRKYTEYLLIGPRKNSVKMILDFVSEKVMFDIDFILHYPYDDIVNYEIDKKHAFHIFDNNLAKKININENTNFNSAFYSMVFGTLLKDSHTVLKDIRSILHQRLTLENLKSSNHYLIRNDIFKNFDFDLFINDVFNLASRNTSKTNIIKIDEYLNKFINSDSKFIFDEVKPLCLLLLSHEFNIEINAKGELELKRNSNYLNTVIQYIFNIIEEREDWMTLSEIYEIVKQKHPYIKIDMKTLRRYILENKELFIYKGRESTYALKKWENEKNNIKKGTISDIAYEYLSNKNEPKHVSEIINYVNQFERKTYSRSILVLLRVEFKKRFIIYEGDFIGLVSKQNSENYLLKDNNSRYQHKNKPTWDEMFERLRLYNESHSYKIPSFTMGGKEEQKLNTFYFKNLNLYRENKLDKDKLEMFKSHGILLSI